MKVQIYCFINAVLMSIIFFSISEEDSVFDESDVHDTPTGAANKESQTFFARLKRIGGSKSVKYQPVELNARKSKKQTVSEGIIQHMD